MPDASTQFARQRDDTAVAIALPSAGFAGRPMARRRRFSHTCGRTPARWRHQFGRGGARARRPGR